MMENSFDEQYRYFDENFAVIRQEIAEAALKSGRNPDEVSLLAATKTVPVQVINYAISQGLTCIGENRVQELLDKYELLQLGSCDCQFIGQLQTNKVKYLVGKVSCIQSLDLSLIHISITSVHSTMRKMRQGFVLPTFPQESSMWMNAMLLIWMS